jgi:hypothetical protein
MAIETQVGDDSFVQSADPVGARVNLETGENLLGRRSAARQVASLYDKNILACPGEIGGSYKSIVTGTNNDSVKCLVH